MIEGPALALQVHEVKSEPNQPFTTIELTAKLRRVPETTAQQSNPYGPEFNIFRTNPGQAQNQVEILDARGRTYPQWYTFNPQPSNEGLRLTLRLMPAEGLGPPTEIRYYEMSRAETEIRFELTDIPMP